MMRLRSGGVVCLGGLVLAISCSSGGGGSIGGTLSANGATPTLTPMTCHAACAARTQDGNLALKSGNYAAAFEAYRCGDTPEAAFGAGLTAILTAIEGESATSVFADFGQTGLKATDIFSSNGWLGRQTRSWHGSGSVTRTDQGGQKLEAATFTTGRQLPLASGVSSGSVSARLYSPESLAKISLSFSTSGAVAPGQRIPVGCSSTGTVSYPTVTYTTSTLSCSTSFSTASPCPGSDGAIVVQQFGNAAGQPVEYNLDNVLVNCRPRSGAQPSTQGTPARLNGTLSLTLGERDVDLTGLPPLLVKDDPVAPKLPPGITLEKVLSDAKGIAGSFELASCYLDAAGGAGTSKAFEIPAEVAGSAVTVTGGDARVFAGLSSLSAAAIVLVEAYRLPLELRGLICGGGVDCLADDEMVRRINAGIGALVDREKIAIGRRLVASALSSWAAAPAGLGPASLFIRDASTSASIDKMKTIIDALRTSIDAGPVSLPLVAPDLRVDLRALFDNPPDPDKLNVDPLTYNAASHRAEGVDAFFEQAVPSSTFSFSNPDKYKFDNGNSFVLDGMSDRFSGYFPF